MVGLSLLGGVLAYSPVPYGDMWDGAIDFMARAAAGAPLDWWAQHNEHRILLSRLLFFLDLECCHAVNWPLIVTNYLLAAASTLVMLRILHRSMEGPGPAGEGEIVVGLGLVAWLFLWVQQENLTWAFQSQFFLAQLLPLSAFYCCSRSIGPPPSLPWFVTACVLGAASTATMANGLLALPLLALYAWATRQGPLQIATMAGLAAATLLLYLHGYQSPGRQDSVLQTATHDPVGTVVFALLYLGSPFYQLAGGGSIGTGVAAGCGLLLTCLTIQDAVAARQQPRQPALPLALVAYILYATATALATAGGRLASGIDQAVSSRYTTPPLIAWAALAVLHAPLLVRDLEARRRRVLVPCCALAALMLVAQLHALAVPRAELFEREIAALALELQVDDPGQIRWIFPDARVALELASRASELRLSVFGQYPLAGLRGTIGAVIEPANLPACRGKLDPLQVARIHPRFVSVSGWLYDEASARAPRIIRVVSADSRVIGYALAGGQRDDLPADVVRNADLAGFRGYLLADDAQGPLELRAEDPACRMTAPAASRP